MFISVCVFHFNESGRENTHRTYSFSHFCFIYFFGFSAVLSLFVYRLQRGGEVRGAHNQACKGLWSGLARLVTVYFSRSFVFVGAFGCFF